MLAEIKEGLLNLNKIKSLRHLLWFILSVGIALIIFESITQHFTTSNLKSRAELLATLSAIDTNQINNDQVTNLHTSLINDTIKSNYYASNPSAFILEKLLRFIQGAYLGLLLFYFTIKTFIFVLKNTDKGIQNFVLMIGSLVFSITAWLATILGAISVVWNNSDDALVSWMIFPFLSFLTFLPIAICLFILSIFLPGNRKKSSPEKPSQIDT